MSVISINTIVHCTSYEGLCGILQSKYFRPSYCLEEFSYLDFERMNFVNNNVKNGHKFALPMVSFTDLPKDKRKQHYKRYGEYAIIMSNSWKLANKLSPVLYVDREFFSAKYGLTKVFDYLLQMLEKEQNEDTKRIQKTYTSFFMMFLKSFSSEGKDYLYYNEREWRWIPIYFDKLKMVLSAEEFNDPKEKENVQQLVWSNKNNLLHFNFEDIIRIEIPNCKYRKEFITLLTETFSVDYNISKKKIMCRKK